METWMEASRPLTVYISFRVPVPTSSQSIHYRGGHASALSWPEGGAGQGGDCEGERNNERTPPWSASLLSSWTSQAFVHSHTALSALGWMATNMLWRIMFAVFPEAKRAPFLISMRAHKESSCLTIRSVRFLTDGTRMGPNPEAAGGKSGRQHARCLSLMYSFLLGGLRFIHSDLKEIHSIVCLSFSNVAQSQQTLSRVCCHLLATCQYTRVATPASGEKLY